MQDLPTASLKLLPAGVVQNCTVFQLTFNGVGCATHEIEAFENAPIDWQPLRHRARKALLSYISASGEKLVCEAFALEPGDVLVALRRASAGCILTYCRAADRLFLFIQLKRKTSSHISSPRRAGAGSKERRLAGGSAVLYLAVRIELQQHPVPSTAPSLETLYITISPGCYASNLTKLTLHLQPTGTAYGTAEPLKVFFLAPPALAYFRYCEAHLLFPLIHCKASETWQTCLVVTD